MQLPRCVWSAVWIPGPVDDDLPTDYWCKSKVCCEKLCELVIGLAVLVGGSNIWLFVGSMKTGRINQCCSGCWCNSGRVVLREVYLVSGHSLPFWLLNADRLFSILWNIVSLARHHLCCRVGHSFSHCCYAGFSSSSSSSIISAKLTCPSIFALRTDKLSFTFSSGPRVDECNFEVQSTVPGDSMLFSNSVWSSGTEQDS